MARPMPLAREKVSVCVGCKCRGILERTASSDQDRLILAIERLGRRDAIVGVAVIGLDLSRPDVDQGSEIDGTVGLGKRVVGSHFGDWNV